MLIQWTEIHQRQKTFRHLQRAVTSVGLHVCPHLFIYVLGRSTQAQFPERLEIAPAKEPVDGTGYLLGDIDFAVFQPLQQFLGRQVYELNL